MVSARRLPGCCVDIKHLFMAQQYVTIRKPWWFSPVVAGERKEELMNSRNKGAKGERELARVLKQYGYDCRRGQQYCGANGDADVVGLPGIHIECKRVERLNIQDAVDQAKRDKRAGEIPAVFHRKNNCDWLVTLPIDDFMTIYREWEAGRCQTGS